MELADILAPDCVLVCTDSTGKAEILNRLAHVAAAASGLPSDQILTAILDREELGSTGLGDGIAIPHGKVAGLDRVIAVFARVEPPVDFDAVDDQPVDLVMMLLAPPGAGADHLKALARVARLLRNDDTVDGLRAAESSATLYSVLMQPLPTSVAA
jgi:PTS system nitrogen regulatory IIA component